MVRLQAPPGFDWKLFPEAETFLQRQLASFLKKNTFARDFAARIEPATSTRFFDWVDYLSIPKDTMTEKELARMGFVPYKVRVPEGVRAFYNPGSVFFPVLLNAQGVFEVAIKPEDLDHFLQMLGNGTRSHGLAHAPYRTAILSEEGKTRLLSVERRGYQGFAPAPSGDLAVYAEVLHTFFTRKRSFSTDAEGMRATLRMVKNATKTLSSPRVADAFFRAERMYWEHRNSPGQLQRNRQDRFGLGWGNHDHHTYRSSREHFATLIEIFEQMGYGCRERFYAGDTAGWGAQILEHPECGIVIFADVDLAPTERKGDFAHKPLTHNKKLGTVGLWVALHGESILQAGMHHLEARFDFEQLISDFQNKNVQTMPPFSHFSFLKQAFVQPEFWSVQKERLDRLLSDESITEEQYRQFMQHGARGSHLENLQRTQGFKGFNQNSVSAIIRATDPRKMDKRDKTYA